MRAKLLADESGFTLVELLVVMLILGVLIVPISASLILGLISNTATRDRVTDSAGAQLVSSYFPIDVQGATDVATTGTCGGPLTVIQFHHADPDPSLPVGTPPPETTVAYVKVSDIKGTQLHRLVCSGGSTDDTRLVQSLGKDPEVTCTYPPSPAFVPCTQPMPRLVKISVQSKSTEADDRAYDAYDYSFTAARRVNCDPDPAAPTTCLTAPVT